MPFHKKEPNKNMKKTNIKHALDKFLHSVRALGTPVANLMIIVAAVSLSTTVMFFAVNVTTSQVQKENLYISETHIWYINSTHSVGSMVVVNTGPTDIVLSRIVVKGLKCTYNSTTNYMVYNKTNAGVPSDLPFVSNFTSMQTNTITIGGLTHDFVGATEGLTVKSGWTLMAYLAIPETFIVYDLGQPARITLTTTQAAYCTETLVQTAT